MAKKGKSRHDSGIPKKIFTQQIIGVLNDNPDQGFNYKQIAKRLNISDESQKRIISEILIDLTNRDLPRKFTRVNTK